jgi:hypothetical protein
MRRTSCFSLGLFALSALVALAACGSDSGGKPEQGNAFLRIVGQAQVEIGDGMPRELTVRYEDQDGNPLAGEIAFAFGGDARGSQLTVASATTDTNGQATVRLLPGQNIEGDAVFNVVASAAYATDASWNIAIYDAIRTYKLEGTYDLDSTFDLVEGVPGTLGNVIREIESMTQVDENNGRYGISTWALDKLMTSADVGQSVKDILQGMRPELDAAVKTIIDQYSPNWVNGILMTAGRITDYARHFNTVSELVITKGEDGTYTAKHTLIGFVFNGEATVTLASLGFAPGVDDHISVTTAGRSITLGEHSFDVAYGQLLLFAINHYLVPELADLLNVADASDLNDLFQGIVDCHSVAEWIFGENASVGIAVGEAACRSGVRSLTTYIESQIVGLAPGAASRLTLRGTATARLGHDGESVEKLNGFWEGSFKIDAAISNLTQPDQIFIGTPRVVTQ